MIKKLFAFVFGTANSRKIKRLEKKVQEINLFEDELSKLTDIELKNKTKYFVEIFSKNKGNQDKYIAEVYAVAREACRRVLNMRPYDVQLMAGLVLNEGNVAEMKTGEGKTLVSLMPAYFNALIGNNVHIVTVNDYLAMRDSEIMKPVFEFLGLQVGVLKEGDDSSQKIIEYKKDIVYGTNNEFGFDYLRDNMSPSADFQAQKSLDFCIIDEVDSILIDEARTPLIISGATEQTTDIYEFFRDISSLFERAENKEDEMGDFYIDEKQKSASLLESGFLKLEDILVENNLLKTREDIYLPLNLKYVHMLEQALRARCLYKKDVEYVILDGEVVIVDEFTGRLQEGRRWSDGLHQAIEAKEGLEIQKESKTMASTTLQNYFKMYKKISGMTGTAATEAEEFLDVYNLDVVSIPTNKPLLRNSDEDQMFLTHEGKMHFVIEDVKEHIERGQPVLIGTPSIDVSESVSAALKEAGVPHNILNAKNHLKEAEIIANAGVEGAVTISTNMAGRGTDIMLGGNSEFFINKYISEGLSETEAAEKWSQSNKKINELGGLRVIGLERNESRRIDDQLVGRCGRQGDNGSSCFYISLDDHLMRVFGGDQLKGVWSRLGVSDTLPVSHSILSKTVRNAQKKLESMNYESRKNILSYDSVNSVQRDIIYDFRNKILLTDNLTGVLDDFALDVLDNLLDEHASDLVLPEQWSAAEINSKAQIIFNLDFDLVKWLSGNEHVSKSLLKEYLFAEWERAQLEKMESFGRDYYLSSLQNNIINSLDAVYTDHLSNMTELRSSIHLRGYANKKPLEEYKFEGFEMFSRVLIQIKSAAVTSISHQVIESLFGDEDIFDSSNFKIPSFNFGKNVEKAVPSVNKQKPRMSLFGSNRIGV